MAQNAWVSEFDAQIRRFLREACELAEGHKTHSRDLHRGYYRWCQAEGEIAVCAANFHAWMERLGHARQFIERRYYYVGLRLVA